jgi:hypothetical protein
VKYPYRPFSLNHIDPVTKLDYAWRPALKVLIWYQHKKSAPIESILDTGADHCVFDAQIGDHVGIPVTNRVPVPRQKIHGMTLFSSDPTFCQSGLAAANHVLEIADVFPWFG